MATCARAIKSGVSTVLLLPCVSVNKKSKYSNEACRPDNHYIKTIRSIRAEFPALTIITDIALGPYSLDGHDGIFENGKVDDTATLGIFEKMAELHANAGADYLGLSEMMDGRVAAVRLALDKSGHEDVGIMAYVKFASCLYGPFRALIHSQLQGDKRSYQIDPANGKDALLEAIQDVKEGADALIVKPAIPYLDITYRLSQKLNIPVIAYHVSGESAMIKSAAHFGYLDDKDATHEILCSAFRAGASGVITYSAIDAAEHLSANKTDSR